MSNAFHIRSTRIRTGVHLVTVKGDFDLDGATSLRKELERLAGGGDVVVDLGAMEVFEPVTLGVVLLRASRRLHDSGARLIVVCDREEILRLFERARLDAHLCIEPSLDDALRYVIGRVLLERVQRM